MRYRHRQIVALYPAHVAELEGQPGVRIRKRNDRTWTQVECDVDTTAENPTAKPRYAPPAATPPPMYRIQMECQRHEGTPTSSVGLVIQPRGPSGPADVEQRVLAPIYNNGRRLVFEFDSGDVLHVTKAGEVEVRFIAIDRVTGQVGTRTHGKFHTRYLGLVAKCVAQLDGTTDLFPVQPRSPRGAAQVPKGEADLSFGPAPRAHSAPDAPARATT